MILIAPISIPIERSTGCVSDWSMLYNDWPIQKFDLLTLTMGAYSTVKYLNHAFPDLYKRVKLMAKVQFSVLIGSTLKSFGESMKV